MIKKRPPQQNLKRSTFKMYLRHSFLSLAFLLFFNVGCDSEEQTECKIYSEMDAKKVRAATMTATDKDEDVIALRQFSAMAVTSFASAPTLPGDYQWDGKNWSGEVDDSENALFILRYPGGWVLTTQDANDENRLVPSTLTRPGFKLKRDFSGVLDGAADWSLTIEMGDWKYASWNCFSCGCPESGEILETPWASSEKSRSPSCGRAVDKISIRLKGSTLTANFKDTINANSTIEFNESKETFSPSLSTECPGLKERVHASFPDVLSIFDHLESAM